MGGYVFIGCEVELDSLTSLWDKSTSSLVTCRGRRRIGKSSLIEEFARRTADTFIALEGIAPRKGLSDRRQRMHICEQLSVFAYKRVRAATWILAFQQLDAVIPSDGRMVVLLIQTRKSLFVVEIKRQRRIPSEVIAEVEQKVKRLSVPADKSVRTVLVYAGELDPRVEADHGFDFLIPVSRLVM